MNGRGRLIGLSHPLVAAAAAVIGGAKMVVDIRDTGTFVPVARPRAPAASQSSSLQRMLKSAKARRK